MEPLQWNSKSLVMICQFSLLTITQSETLNSLFWWYLPTSPTRRGLTQGQKPIICRCLPPDTTWHKVKSPKASLFWLHHVLIAWLYAYPIPSYANYIQLHSNSTTLSFFLSFFYHYIFVFYFFFFGDTVYFLFLFLL